MNLLDIRKKVVQLSGRYDLVVNSTDYADNGMDYFINAGMSMLDKMVTIPDSTARLFYSPVAGEYSITLPSDSRVLQEVWASNAEARYQLSKLTPSEFKEYYCEPISETTAGAPMHYAFIDLRSLAPDLQSSLAEYLDKPAAEGSGHGFRGLVFGPQFDAQYDIEVVGLFKQITLSADADINFWTFKEPDLLVRAALYKLEVHSQGTENAKNWISAIRDDIMLLDFDMAEEESYDIDQLEG